jgi:hypothetical protein
MWDLYNEPGGWWYRRGEKPGEFEKGLTGKTNTIWAWDSWSRPKTEEPNVWHHDILRRDGVPFDKEETDFIQKIIIQDQSIYPD